MNFEEQKAQYLKSAENLERTRIEFEQVLEAGPKKEFFRLKYMGALILNEMCREVLYLESNPTLRDSKLAALAPIILSLYESYIWYTKDGNKRLRELAAQRGMIELVEADLRELKKLKASNILQYESYRNQLAGHFSVERIELLSDFGKIDFKQFEIDVIRVISYGNGWLQILKKVGLLSLT